METIANTVLRYGAALSAAGIPLMASPGATAIVDIEFGDSLTVNNGVQSVGSNSSFYVYFFRKGENDAFGSLGHNNNTTSDASIVKSITYTDEFFAPRHLAEEERGESITAAQPFETSLTLSSQESRTLSFGFVLTASPANGGDPVVGWFRVAFGGLGPDTYIAGAFNDDGGPIEAGRPAVIPLPASLPLAGLGILALGALSRRRRPA